jgi:hypothetical protein
MMAITTSNSTSVNAVFDFEERIAISPREPGLAE